MAGCWRSSPSNERKRQSAIAQSGGRYKGVANINNTMSDDELAALGRRGPLRAAPGQQPLHACPQFDIVAVLGSTHETKLPTEY